MDWTSWRMKGPSGKVLTCGVYRHVAQGVEARCGYSPRARLRKTSLIAQHGKIVWRRPIRLGWTNYPSEPADEVCDSSAAIHANRWRPPCSANDAMVSRNTAVGLRDLRLFGVTFLFSFSLFTTSLAALHWISVAVEVPQVTAPSERPEEPRDRGFSVPRLLRV